MVGGLWDRHKDERAARARATERGRLLEARVFTSDSTTATLKNGEEVSIKSMSTDGVLQVVRADGTQAEIGIELTQEGFEWLQENLE